MVREKGSVVQETLRMKYYEERNPRGEEETFDARGVRRARLFFENERREEKRIEEKETA